MRACDAAAATAQARHAHTVAHGSHSYVFSDLLSTRVTVDGRAQWYKARVSTYPSVRYDHAAAVVRNGDMLVTMFGQFRSLWRDGWAAVPRALLFTPARPEDFFLTPCALRAGATTCHCCTTDAVPVAALSLSPTQFLLAIMCVMGLCFCVYAIAARRANWRRVRGAAAALAATAWQCRCLPLRLTRPPHSAACA